MNVSATITAVGREGDDVGSEAGGVDAVVASNAVTVSPSVRWAEVTLTAAGRPAT